MEHFDYKAFRYVEVIAHDDNIVKPESFAAIVRHYPLMRKAADLKLQTNCLMIFGSFAGME